MISTRRIDKRRKLLAKWGWLSVLCTVIVAAGIAMLSRRSSEAVPAAGADIEGLTSVLTKEIGSERIPIRFEDITAQVGVSFRHMPFARASLLPEDIGSGVAVGDFDDDGFDDLYFVNFSGSVIPGAKQDEKMGRARLYRNINGESFEDVTDRAGVGFVGHGLGAAWGDYDGDDDLDLYVTAFGDNILYQNQGDGTFKNVASQAGVQDSRFSTGCNWSDYDRDGHLDLYVCNYVDFVFREGDRGASQRQYDTEQPYTLNPSSYAAQPNSLFRNNGDGTFEQVAESAGVADPKGRSLSASWVDLNNDGWVDLYVANDVSNNGVFLNKRNGRFEDVGPSSLAADYRGAMGIAVADFDNDLDQDLLITHWIAQENALYRNMTFDELHGGKKDERLWFMDEADAHGLGQISLDMVGWATGFCDFDNDGLRDLWLVNGSTLETPHDHTLLEAQRPFVFWNRGPEGFVEVARHTANALAQPFVGRGGAQVDLDGDGRVDLIMVVSGGDALVLRNASAPSGHWLRVKLRQRGGNTRALGARAIVEAGGLTQMAEVGSSSSYLSQDELTLHFGVGEAERIETLRIVWPDGQEETHRNLPVDQQLKLTHTPTYPLRIAAHSFHPFPERDYSKGTAQ